MKEIMKEDFRRQKRIILWRAAQGGGITDTTFNISEAAASMNMANRTKKNCKANNLYLSNCKDKIAHHDVFYYFWTRQWSRDDTKNTSIVFSIGD